MLKMCFAFARVVFPTSHKLHRYFVVLINGDTPVVMDYGGIVGHGCCRHAVPTSPYALSLHKKGRDIYYFLRKCQRICVLELITISFVDTVMPVII